MEIEANVDFFLALLKKFCEPDVTGNIFYSPFSISEVLAKLIGVCRGNTASQISQVLRLSGAKQPTEETEKPMMTLSHMKKELQLKLEKTASTSSDYLKQVLNLVESEEDIYAVIHQHFSESNNEYLLNIDDWLYFEEHIYTFVEEYIAEYELDYKADPDKYAKKNIKSWVEVTTQGKIRTLIKDKREEKRFLVLINTISFEGKWEKKFFKLNTAERPFHINKNDTKSVMMMSQEGQFNLFDIPEVNCQILELPYEGNVFSMLIFLPNGIKDSTTGLEELQRELTYKKIMEWTSSDQCGCKVKVGLPRFTMKFSYDLTDRLISMGMADAFDRNKSDFSGISPEKDCVLSKFIHRASVEVDEGGIVAKAVSYRSQTMVVRSSAVESFELPKSFIADHPFLFFIRYNPMSTILFAGQVTSP